ncbi:MAG TPA: hypothetical protein VF121_14905 [Thermoanaerobaculia bacterium]|nr:hypothetical protein [Thermoanaerobaculia bacterium]
MIVVGTVVRFDAFGRNAMKKPYAAPSLRRLGLLRQVTRFSF